MALPDDALRRYQDARVINRAFYTLLSEEQADTRLTPRSASPRECLAHQIRVQEEYMLALRTGRLVFGVLSPMEEELAGAPLPYLLAEMERSDAKLRRLTPVRRVKTPWGIVGVRAILGYLREHEILHTGGIVFQLDGLGLSRYLELSATWGE